MTMATEGFECSGDECSDVESSSDDSLVEEEVTIIEGEVESRASFGAKIGTFYKAMVFVRFAYCLYLLLLVHLIFPYLLPMVWPWFVYCRFVYFSFACSCLVYLLIFFRLPK